MVFNNVNWDMRTILNFTNFMFSKTGKKISYFTVGCKKFMRVQMFKKMSKTKTTIHQQGEVKWCKHSEFILMNLVTTENILAGRIIHKTKHKFC